MFAFSAAAGAATVTLSIVPGAGRPNLDAKIDVTAAGAPAPLATFNTAGGLLQGSFPVTLPAAGIYYVGVTGVGDGLNASVGYSSYASLGEYGLTVDFPTNGPAVPPPPSSSPVSGMFSPPAPSASRWRLVQTSSFLLAIAAGRLLGT